MDDQTAEKFSTSGGSQVFSARWVALTIQLLKEKCNGLVFQEMLTLIRH